MTVFVWTKMGVESGEKLEQIVRRKEAERVKGNGQFWWGVGNSLGPAVRDAARAGRHPASAVFGDAWKTESCRQ
jgi:hypothetical protein